MATRAAAAGPQMRFGIITWMLMIAALALPMHAIRVAWDSPKDEGALVTAAVASGLGGVGLASAVAAESSRRRERMIALTWWVVAFQALGVSVPDPFDILLMPLGLVSGTFLLLWITGKIRI